MLKNCDCQNARTLPLRGRSIRDAFAFVTMAGPVVRGCSQSIFGPQGPIGVAEKTILLNSLVIMPVIVVPTILAALAFAWNLTC